MATVCLEQALLTRASGHVIMVVLGLRVLNNEASRGQHWPVRDVHHLAKPSLLGGCARWVGDGGLDRGGVEGAFAKKLTHHFRKLII